MLIPKNYKPMLVTDEMEQAIKQIKLVFQEELSQVLSLRDRKSTRLNSSH